MTSPRLLAPTLLGALLVPACAPAEPEAHTGPPRNAVIILLDTLRADHLGSYGYDRATTPNLDALAARGARFSQAFSPAPWTLPATGSLLTGLPPDQAFDEELRLRRSLVEDLAEAGYRTAAFTEGAFVSDHFGMDRGFGAWTEQAALQLGGEEFRDERRASAQQDRAGAAETVDASIAWLREHADEPFVLLVHTYEAHTPYRKRRFAEELDPGRVGRAVEIQDIHAWQEGGIELTAAELEYVTALYDGGIRAADRHVGRLLEALAELGLDDETLIVVTSDHGEELGEHFPRFVADHGHSLKDELLRVPLIVADPSRDWRGEVVDWQVRLMDVLPTVLDLLGVPASATTAGRSLLPMLTGGEARHRPAVAGHTKTGPPRLALRDGRHKLILVTEGETPEGPELVPAVPHRQLYVLADDPGETRNMEEPLREVAEALSRALRTWQRHVGNAAGHLRPDAADEELRARLAELGYVR